MSAAASFLASLFLDYDGDDRDDLRLELRALPPAWDRSRPYPWPRKWYCLEPVYLENAARHAIDWGEEWDVYYSCLPRLSHQGGAAGVTRARMLWADIDIGNGSQDDALNQLFSAGLPTPHYVVSSGWGLHAYWLLSHTVPLLTVLDQEQFSQTLQRLSMVIGVSDDGAHADQGSCDVARILRVPETINHKSADHPQPVRIRYRNLSAKRHSYAAWRGALPVLLPMRTIVITRPARTAGGFLTQGMRAWSAVGFVEGHRHHDLYCAATWLIRDKGLPREDVELLLFAKSAVSTGKPMPHEEVIDIIDSAERKYRGR